MKASQKSWLFMLLGILLSGLGQAFSQKAETVDKSKLTGNSCPYDPLPINPVDPTMPTVENPVQ